MAPRTFRAEPADKAPNAVVQVRQRELDRLRVIELKARDIDSILRQPQRRGEISGLFRASQALHQALYAP